MVLPGAGRGLQNTPPAWFVLSCVDDGLLIGVGHSSPELPQGLTGGHSEIFSPPKGEPVDEGLRRHESVLLVQADVVCHVLESSKNLMEVKPLKKKSYRG
jgi:hypothetical protein